jgi:hypothetical protein
MKPQLIIIAFLGLLSCNTGTDTNMPVVEAKEELEETPSINIDSLEYIVLPYDTAKFQMFPTQVRPAELTKAEISQAEVLMLDQVEKYNQKRTQDYYKIKTKYPDYNFQIETFIIENPAHYARQYISVINSDGQKIVYINAFCSLQGHDYWKADLVDIMGGGDCYFQTMINLSTKEVLNFSVNSLI